MKKLTTILCSNYNSKKWINNYLKYLNEQTLKCFDVIFVDANSTDDSLNIIKNHKFRDGISTKIFEHKSRISIYDAWNEAILSADTPYVINYNTDDCLFPNALLINEQYAEAKPSIDVFYSPCLISSDENHLSIKGIHFWENYSHSNLLNRCFIGPFPYLKRSSIIEDGLFNPKYTISGDYEMWLRMSKKGRSFYRIPEVFGCYFENPLGNSTKQSDNRLKIHLAQDYEIRNLYK